MQCACNNVWGDLSTDEAGDLPAVQPVLAAPWMDRTCQHAWWPAARSGGALHFQLKQLTHQSAWIKLKRFPGNLSMLGPFLPCLQRSVLDDPEAPISADSFSHGHVPDYPAPGTFEPAGIFSR